MEQGPKFQGSLEKQGRIAKSWKKYWFLLKESQLTYVKSQDKMTSQGHVDMSQAQSVRSVSGNHGYPFEIVTKSRTHNMSAETASQRDKWVKILHDSMAWHSRRTSSSRSSSTGSSLIRASCNSIEEYEDVSSSPTGSPSRSSGYSSATSSRASDLVIGNHGDGSGQRDSGMSDIMYTNPEYMKSTKPKPAPRPSLDRQPTANSLERQPAANSLERQSATNSQAMYEDIDARGSSRQSKHEGLRRLYPTPSGASTQGSVYSNSSGIYDEVQEDQTIAISHIVKGYANIARNKGPQPEKVKVPDEDESDPDYDDVFMCERASTTSTVTLRKSARPSQLEPDYENAERDFSGREASYVSIGDRNTLTSSRVTSSPVSCHNPHASDVTTDMDSYFEFPPVLELPHPRKELFLVNDAFSELRRFLANNRGPNEVYGPRKPEDTGGNAIRELKDFLAVHTE